MSAAVSTQLEFAEPAAAPSLVAPVTPVLVVPLSASVPQAITL